MEQSQGFLVWLFSTTEQCPFILKIKSNLCNETDETREEQQGQAWKESMDKSPHEMPCTEPAVGLWRQLRAGQAV